MMPSLRAWAISALTCASVRAPRAICSPLEAELEAAGRRSGAVPTLPLTSCAAPDDGSVGVGRREPVGGGVEGTLPPAPLLLPASPPARAPDFVGVEPAPQDASSTPIAAQASSPVVICPSLEAIARPL